MITRNIAIVSTSLLAGSLLGALPTASYAAPGTGQPDRSGDQTVIAPGSRIGKPSNGTTAQNETARSVPPRTLTHRWSSQAELVRGTNGGVTTARGSLRIDQPKGTLRVPDPFGAIGNRTFDWSRWTSPWKNTRFNANNLIPSWNARTPGRTFIRIEARTRTGKQVSSWDKVADWGTSVRGVHRASGPAQPDDLNELNTDTLVSKGARIRGYQLRVTLMRPTGTELTPRVDSISAVAASYTSRSQRVSRTTMTKHTEIAVPRFSQMTHRGHYPKWGGGGQAWCSPTSTAMVLRHYGTGPKPGAYQWTDEIDGQVDHAARFSYDHRYEGTGNWPFNTAYAGHFGMDAYVTRLRNLRDAEKFIRAGIPVVISLAFDKGELTGAPISSTNGHLMVITGFRKDGSVIANDPAAPANRTVRRVYDRAQLEKAWLNASGGVTYVIRPHDKALPAKTNRW